jgi:hypothetical protein
MPIAIDPADRKILIIAGALFVAVSAVGLMVSHPQTPDTAGFPSSYSTAPAGAEAAYLLAGDLGYHVERWLQPPDQLPDAAGKVLLVLAEPLVPASADEKSMISAFVRRGGRVLAIGAPAANLLLETRVHHAPERAFEEKRFSAELPGALTRGAPEIVMRTGLRWGEPTSGQQRFYGDAEGPTVVSFRKGNGFVVWWADSTPLTNHGLMQASNLTLYLNSLAMNARAPGATRVLWDEYFHGQRVSFLFYLARTPVPWALAQLSVLFVAALVTYARRSGPVRAALPDSRLTPLEFIETLGGLYQRKGAARESLAIVYHRFRLLLLSRLRLPSSTPAEEIARGVRQRLGWKVPGFWETLQGCERETKSARVRDREALRLIQELHDYARRFRLEEGREQGLGIKY